MTEQVLGTGSSNGRSPRAAALVEPAASEDLEQAYRAFPSVWTGEDSELLEGMLAFYPRQTPERILDATVNAGRFWRRPELPVVGLDVDPRHRPTVLGDNRCLSFLDKSFDVIVYDPPHVPNQGTDRTKDFNVRFGNVLRSGPQTSYNFTHLYVPFVAEAFRVLKPEGVLFCKITDYVHNHRFQWAHVALINAASEVGFCPCDCIVKVRTGPIVDPKWKVAHHARRHHCYWLVFRKSTKCE